MKRQVLSSFVIGIVALCCASTPTRADSDQISPEHLDVVDHLGYFTPGFKKAVHDLVDTTHALDKSNEEQKKLKAELPALQNQAMQAEAKTAALRQELAKYDHPEENDFAALARLMSDPGAKPEDQIELAQAYVWTYPSSPHEADAQQYLERVQKKMADEQQAEKDAEAAQAAAHAKLVLRAKAHDLSLEEWRDFLRDMSQDDLVKLIGLPSSQADNYWTYSGAWITDPSTHQKVGIQINFNASRVLNVDEIPPQP